MFVYYNMQFLVVFCHLYFVSRNESLGKLLYLVCVHNDYENAYVMLESVTAFHQHNVIV